MASPLINKITSSAGLNNLSAPKLTSNAPTPNFSVAPDVRRFGGFLNNFFNPRIQRSSQPQSLLPNLNFGSDGTFGGAFRSAFNNTRNFALNKPAQVQAATAPSSQPAANAPNFSSANGPVYVPPPNFSNFSPVPAANASTAPSTFGANQGTSQPTANQQAALATNPGGGFSDFHALDNAAAQSQNNIDQAAANAIDTALRTTTISDLNNGSKTKNAEIISNILSNITGLKDIQDQINQYRNAQQQASNQIFLTPGLTSFQSARRNQALNESAGRLIEPLTRQFEAQQNYINSLSGVAKLTQPDVVGSPITDNYGNVTALVRDPFTGQITPTNLGRIGQTKGEFQFQSNPLTGEPSVFNTATGQFGNTAQSSFPFSVSIPQGTLASTNNNPGNLRFVGQQGATQGANGFARFNSPEEGYQALLGQISLDTSRGLTLGQYIQKYAPPSENNTPAYLNQAVQNLGVGANTPLNQINPTKLAQFQIMKESGSTLNPGANNPFAPSSQFGGLPPIVANYVSTDAQTGLKYINSEKVDSKLEPIVKRYAAANGIPWMTDLDISKINNISVTRDNLKTIQGEVNGFLSGGILGRLKGLTINQLANLAQTNPEIAAFKTNREVAINVIQGLAGGQGSGFRLNQAEIETASNNMPTIADNIGTANAKMRMINQFLNRWTSQLLTNGITGTGGNNLAVMTPDGQTFSFPDLVSKNKFIESAGLGVPGLVKS